MYGGVVIRIDQNGRGDSIQMRVFDNTYHDRRQSSVPEASLRTCRQMYQDAKDAFYSTNEFQLICPQPLGVFIQHLDDVNHRALAVRNMHLRVVVYGRKEERECDNGFRALVKSLKNVRHISIFICVKDNLSYRSTPLETLAYRKEPFLPGLLDFKKLPLKTFTLVLEEHSETFWKEGKKYLWTAVQEQEWVQYVEGAVLGLD